MPQYRRKVTLNLFFISEKARIYTEQTHHFYTDLQTFDLQYIKNINQTSQVLKTCEVWFIFRPKHLFIINLQIQYIFLIQSNAFALTNLRREIRKEV